MAIAIGQADLRNFESSESVECLSLEEKKGKNMKPSSITKQNARPFPLVDYHYQSVTLDGSASCCVKPTKSLRDISRDYFETEANYDFLSDAAVFGTLIATAVVPIVSGIVAVLDLVRALPLF